MQKIQTLGHMLRPFAVGVFAMALAACSGGSPEEKADRFYQSGQEKYEEEQYAAAVIELKNALQQLPSHGPSRLLLGQIYLKTYQVPQAEKELRRAQEFNADPAEVVPKLARALILSGQYEETMELIDDAPTDVATRPEVLSYHADALIGQGRYDAARDLLLSANDPSAAMLSRLGQISVLEGDLETARTYARRALDVDPNSYAANLLSGRLYLLEPDREAALAAFKNALKADPYSPQASLNVAAVLIEKGELEEASATLEKLASIGFDSVQSAYLKSLIAMQQEDFELAKTESERVLSVAPRNAPALLVAGVANSALGNDEAAINYLQRFSNQEEAPSAARRALAWSNLRLGRADDALQAIEGGGERAEQDFGSLRLAAAAAIGAGQLEKAEGYLRNMLEEDPENISLSLGLASLKLAAGDEAGAEEILAAIPDDVESQPYDQRVRLGLVYLRAGEFEKAISIARGLQQSEPDRAAGTTLMGLILAQQDQVDGAVGAFQEAVAMEPANVTANLALASIYLQQEKLDAAMTVIEQALSVKPDDPQLNLAHVQLLMQAGKAQEAVSAMQGLADSQPESAQLQLMNARLLLTTGQTASALDAARKAQTLAPDNAAVLETLGLTYRGLGQHEEAVHAFETLVRRHSENADAYYLLGRSLAEAGRDVAAIGALRRALELDEDKTQARMGITRLLALRGDLDEAKQQLEILKMKEEATAALHDLEGFVHLRSGDTDAAAASYRAAYEADKNPGRGITLARTLWVAERQDEATALLESLDTPLASLQLAQLYNQQGRWSDARSQYEELLANEADNPIYLNDYAWGLWENGEVEEAYKHARRAVELAPSAAAIQDTYGVILLERGDVDAAVMALHKASELAPDDPDIRLHYAKALIAQGDTSKARGLLASLADLKSFPGYEEAQNLLQEIGGS